MKTFAFGLVMNLMGQNDENENNTKGIGQKLKALQSILSPTNHSKKWFKTFSLKSHQKRQTGGTC